MPPMMVAPERETPGIMATHCATPTPSACLALICSSVWAVARSSEAVSSAAPGASPGVCGARRSTHSMMNPPTTSVTATTPGW